MPTAWQRGASRSCLQGCPAWDGPELPSGLHAGVALTMLRFFGPSLAKSGLVAPKLTAPFARIVDRVVTNPWLRRFLDLECFVLSGMLAKDTICAEVCPAYLSIIPFYGGRSTCRAAIIEGFLPLIEVPDRSIHA